MNRPILPLKLVVMATSLHWST